MNQKSINKILHQTREIYNTIAADFARTRLKERAIFGKIKDYVKLNDKILDLGCGNGRLAEVCKESQIEYLGIDNSREMIKIARERFKDYSWAKFEQGEIVVASPKGAKQSHPSSMGLLRRFAPRNDVFFDLVLMLAALHHIPTKRLRLKILRDIYQLLKPGGCLIMSNWNLWRGFDTPSLTKGRRGRGGRRFQKYTATSPWPLLRKEGKYYWPYLFYFKTKIKNGVWSLFDAFVPWKMTGEVKIRYVHSFRLGELKRLMKKAGFKVEEIYYENRGEKTNIWQGNNSFVVGRKEIRN